MRGVLGRGPPKAELGSPVACFARGSLFGCQCEPTPHPGHTCQQVTLGTVLCVVTLIMASGETSLWPIGRCLCLITGVGVSEGGRGGQMGSRHSATSHWASVSLGGSSWWEEGEEVIQVCVEK